METNNVFKILNRYLYFRIHILEGKFLNRNYFISGILTNIYLTLTAGLLLKNACKQNTMRIKYKNCMIRYFNNFKF